MAFQNLLKNIKRIFFSLDDFGEITQNDGESNLPMSAREINQLFAITNKFEMVTFITILYSSTYLN